MTIPEEKNHQSTEQPVLTATEIAALRAASLEAAPSGETPKTIAALEDELALLRDATLRSRADFENTRKRLQREKEDAIKYANSTLIERLLPVSDSFELGLAEARKHESAAPIVNGFDLVQKQLADFLKENGVEAVEALGQPFDPNLHQALGNQPSSEYSEGTVSLQLRKGYKLRDRLLRPAMVFVSSGLPEEA